MKNEHQKFLALHEALAKVDETKIPVMTRDRLVPRAEQARLARALFRQLGLKGISVTQPNYSMCFHVRIRMPWPTEGHDRTAWPHFHAECCRESLYRAFVKDTGAIVDLVAESADAARREILSAGDGLILDVEVKKIGDGHTDATRCPACRDGSKDCEKLKEILARAFPSHEDRSESMTDYYDFKWMVD